MSVHRATGRIDTSPTGPATIPVEAKGKRIADRLPAHAGSNWLGSS